MEGRAFTQRMLWWRKDLVALSLARLIVFIFGVGREEGQIVFLSMRVFRFRPGVLELVADAILRLSQDGRMVGIVTHDPSFCSLFSFAFRSQGRESFLEEKRGSYLTPIFCEKKWRKSTIGFYEEDSFPRFFRERK